MRWHKILKIIIFIISCELVGIIGSYFTISSVGSWYATLIKPSFSPPSWLFGPAWLILYALMGSAAFLISEKGLNKRRVKNALTLFVIQLFLNGVWTPLFFGLKEIFLAWILIMILLMLILVTVIKFLKINRLASYLLIPYLFWVSFAGILNFSIWYLNK